MCVYGVEVPGIEGRAGMACICDPGGVVDVDRLREAMDGALPPYTRPVFLRFTVHGIDKTTTFKFKKNKLRDEGFNPSECGGDVLYYFDGKERIFKPVDVLVYQRIVNQEIRF